VNKSERCPKHVNNDTVIGPVLLQPGARPRSCSHDVTFTISESDSPRFVPLASISNDQLTAIHASSAMCAIVERWYATQRVHDYPDATLLSGRWCSRGRRGPTELCRMCERVTLDFCLHPAIHPVSASRPRRTRRARSEGATNAPGHVGAMQSRRSRARAPYTNRIIIVV
jgi:hypothetical protein